MNIPCKLETKTNKSGKEYKVLVISLTDNTEKMVFLEPAELDLLELQSKIGKTQPPIK